MNMKHKDLIEDILAGLVHGYKNGEHKWIKANAILDDDYRHTFSLEMDLDDDGKMDGDFRAKVELDQDTFQIDRSYVSFDFDHINDTIYVYGHKSISKIDNEKVHKLNEMIFKDLVEPNLPSDLQQRNALNKILNKVGRVQSRNRKLDDIIDDTSTPTVETPIETEKTKPKKKGFFNKFF